MADPRLETVGLDVSPTTISPSSDHDRDHKSLREHGADVASPQSRARAARNKKAELEQMLIDITREVEEAEKLEKASREAANLQRFSEQRAERQLKTSTDITDHIVQGLHETMLADVSLYEAIKSINQGGPAHAGSEGDLQTLRAALCLELVGPMFDLMMLSEKILTHTDDDRERILAEFEQASSPDPETWAGDSESKCERDDLEIGSEGTTTVLEDAPVTTPMAQTPVHTTYRSAGGQSSRAIASTEGREEHDEHSRSYEWITDSPSSRRISLLDIENHSWGLGPKLGQDLALKIPDLDVHIPEQETQRQSVTGDSAPPSNGHDSHNLPDQTQHPDTTQTLPPVAQGVHESMTALVSNSQNNNAKGHTPPQARIAVTEPKNVKRRREKSATNSGETCESMQSPKKRVQVMKSPASPASSTKTIAKPSRGVKVFEQHIASLAKQATLTDTDFNCVKCDQLATVPKLTKCNHLYCNKCIIAVRKREKKNGENQEATCLAEGCLASLTTPTSTVTDEEFNDIKCRYLDAGEDCSKADRESNGDENMKDYEGTIDYEEEEAALQNQWSLDHEDA